MSFLRVSQELRSLFRKAKQFIIEEIHLKKEFIDFLQKNKSAKNERELLLELQRLEYLRTQAEKYWRCSHLLLVNPDYEYMENVFDIKPEFIIQPRNHQVTQQDLLFLKRLSNFCEIHQATDCECDDLFPR